MKFPLFKVVWYSITRNTSTGNDSYLNTGLIYVIPRFARRTYRTYPRAARIIVCFHICSSDLCFSGFCQYSARLGLSLLHRKFVQRPPSLPRPLNIDSTFWISVRENLKRNAIRRFYDCVSTLLPFKGRPEALNWEFLLWYGWGEI